MKNSFSRLPSVLMLEIFHFLNLTTLSSLILVEKYPLDILLTSNAKLIDKMIQKELIHAFPYLKGMLLSESCAFALQGNILYRYFQRLQKLMEHYYHHFPLHPIQPLKDKSFWVQFNLRMGLGLSHLMVKNYLLTQEEYGIIFLRDYQGDNLIAGLHKKAIGDKKEIQQSDRLILEEIFQGYIPQILGLYYQRHLTASENIHHYFQIFLLPKDHEKNSATPIKLFALSLACHQGEMVEKIQGWLVRIHDGYLNNARWVTRLCRQLVKYGAFFALSKWILDLKPTALHALRELAWSLRDFNCFRVLHSVDLNYTPFLKKYYHPVAIQVLLQLNLNILELSSEMIRRILTSIFLSRDFELFGLFIKNWDEQIQSNQKINEPIHELTERGNQIVGTILQKHKLLEQDALFDLMHWLFSRQLISLEKKYYPYYINKNAWGNKTLLEIATLCKLPVLIGILLRLGAVETQQTDKRAVEETRNIHKNVCQDLLRVNLFKSPDHSSQPCVVTNYLLATPAIVIRSGFS